MHCWVNGQGNIIEQLLQFHLASLEYIYYHTHLTPYVLETASYMLSRKYLMFCLVYHSF